MGVGVVVGVTVASNALFPSLKIEMRKVVCLFSTVQYGTKGHETHFSIKIGHGTIPKLYYAGPQIGEFEIVFIDPAVPLSCACVCLHRPQYKRACDHRHKDLPAL